MRWINSSKEIKTIPSFLYFHDNYDYAQKHISFHDKYGNAVSNCIHLSYKKIDRHVPFGKRKQVIQEKSLKAVQHPLRFSTKENNQLDQICTKNFKNIDYLNYYRKECVRAVQNCQKEIISWGKQRGVNISFKEGFNFTKKSTNNIFILSENPMSQGFIGRVTFKQDCTTSDNQHVEVNITTRTFKEIPNRKKFGKEIGKICSTTVSQYLLTDLTSKESKDEALIKIKRNIIDNCSKNNYGAVFVDALTIKPDYGLNGSFDYLKGI